MLIRIFVFFLSLVLFTFTPPDTFAHAFGQLYNLPVPLWLYLYGGAAALVISFFVIGYFFKKEYTQTSYPTIGLSKYSVFRLAFHPWFIVLLKTIGLFFLLFTILSGFVGVDNPRINFNMTFFWIIFVLGFAYLVGLIGDVWAVVNPWKTIVELIEKVLKIKGTVFIYPKQFGYYPALVFYFLFIWVELFGETTPFPLSLILAIYTLVTIAGAIAFGRENWFKYGEFFSVFFGLISKIAPFEYRRGKLYLRPPLVGLLKEKADHFSLVLFILFMLSSTAFDGFHATNVWYRVLGGIVEPMVGIFFGRDSFATLQTARTIGLLFSPVVFLYIYLLLIGLARSITKAKSSVGQLTLSFAFSLVPIALVYNVAHYYTLLLTEGQGFIRIISDPFGYGWNLFSTAQYKTNTAVVNANIAWHTQVGLILLGHIAGVYLAHLIAFRVFHNSKHAFLSQLPTLVLMVVFTMIGLWILAQPIVSESVVIPQENSIPQDNFPQLVYPAPSFYIPSVDPTAN